MKVISAIILVLLAATFGVLFFDSATSTSSPSIAQEQNLTATPDVKPVPLPKTHSLSVSDKKKRFVETTLPAILRVKRKLDSQHAIVSRLARKKELSSSEEALIESLKISYDVEGMPCLLNRLQTHPVSIVLAQAALETGWGTSRFYKEANNIFGIWSYNPDEPRIAASETRGERTIYVKKYDTLDASIEGYFKMMASGYAYRNFRTARKKEQNPFLLLPHLTHYSELREEYVKRLYHVIRSNRFYTYDEPSYKPVPLAQLLPRPKPEPIESETTPEVDVADRSDNEPVDCNNTTVTSDDVNTTSATDTTDAIEA